MCTDLSSYIIPLKIFGRRINDIVVDDMMKLSFRILTHSNMNFKICEALKFLIHVQSNHCQLCHFEYPYYFLIFYINMGLNFSFFGNILEINEQ